MAHWHRRPGFWPLLLTNLAGWAFMVWSITLLILAIGDGLRAESWGAFADRAWPVIPLFAAGQLVQAVGTVLVTRRWNRLP